MTLKFSLTVTIYKFSFFFLLKSLNRAKNSIQGYSRVIMGLTNIETQTVIHFHRLRGSLYLVKKNQNIVDM
jgi:hypothetical protein